MLILVRCNDVASDPRAMKYVNYLRDNNKPYKLIAWDRDGRIKDESEGYYLKKRAGYNVGGLKAVLNRIIWMWFVLKTLIKIKDKSLVIHACDLDAAFPSAIYKLLFNKNTKLIFDVFDWYSATLYNQGAVILKAFALMERFSLKYSDKVIICEKERIAQIPYEIPPHQIWVLPNIPYFSGDSFLSNDEKLSFPNDLLTFAYVGGFCQERCLKEIIDIAESGKINLNIAGYGDIQIEKRLAGLYNHPNIKYYGKVTYVDGMNIMFNSDVIYAMYAKSNPNHIYAAPNKFYESMFVGKPIFSTRGIIVAQKIQELGIGYVSEEETHLISDVVMSIQWDDIKRKGDRARELWETQYKHYTADFLQSSYSAIL